jgi:hypothetical protein
MRALLVVGVDANDQNLLQTGAFFIMRLPGSMMFRTFDLGRIGVR